MSPFRMMRDAIALDRGGVTLQRRLIVFFLLFLVAVMAALFLILFACGVFSAGLREHRAFLMNELGHISDDVSNDFAAISLEGVAVSRRLSEHLDKALSDRNTLPSQLQASPEYIEVLLDGCLDILHSALEKGRASGAYIVLNATVNPSLPDASHSRAGLFLKNMEPNAVHLETPAIHLMRGPAALARSRNMTMLPQWRMEFTISDGDFFNITDQAARASTLPLSRLYHWNGSEVLAGDYQESILLTVPLIAYDGSVYGVCGFEISAMLFKLQNLPDNTRHTRALSVLAPISGNKLDASRALFAGNFSLPSGSTEGEITTAAGNGNLYSFAFPGGETFTGLYSPVNLYPKDSAHANEEWAVCVVLPSEDFDAAIRSQNMAVMLMLFILLLLSAAVSFVLSRRYLMPVIGAINQVIAKSGSEYKKTNIQEIDDLFDYLAEQDTARESKPDFPVVREPVSELYQAFVAGIKTLSPAERAVFNLYMEGYNAREITDILCLSINTIKTHNRRIYMKLRVTSRNELMVYVNMMRELEGLSIVGREE